MGPVPPAPSPLSLSEPSAATLRALESAVPGGVRSRATDRLGMAHDASHYLLTPEAVVAPRSATELGRLLRAAREQGIALTFRSGGTSLSGQAVTGAVLVDTRRHFRAIEVLDGGRRVRVQPGLTVRQVNTHLLPFGTKLGPDPASESACTIGGVVANNSSGMACGTVQNTYRTLDSIVLVLPSGTVVDTSAPDADARLRALEPDLHDGLVRLRERVRSNPASLRTIERQFSLKNTMGYSVNAFVDHDDPAQMLAHLVVGSEGTLAFVAEATFRTVPVLPHMATGLLVFDDLRRANDALPALVAAGLATVELLDAASLRVAQRDPKALDMLRTLAVVDHAALLVEHQELEAAALSERAAATLRLLSSLPLSLPAELTPDPAARAALWHIRKGLYTAVAGARPSGTTALLEDIAVPVPSLAAVCDELVGLFGRHGYEGSVIFGHAKDGNVHFLLNERFDDADRLDRYVQFTEDMVDLVLGAEGTLKAEHGTGRIMAPFVRRQYGDELYEVMCEVKRLCDPDGVLNPGVLLNDDPMLHVRDLKVVPTVEEEVDRCVECGYCEPVCPSKDLTLTPRQRIVLRREMAAAERAGDTALAARLREEYAYDGVDTCAVDGMCQSACPVLINTGDLVRRLRAEDAGAVEQRAWQQAAKHWRGTTVAAGRALDVAAFLPAPLPRAATSLLRKVADPDAVPRWDADLPRGGTPRRPLEAAGATAVHFPSCTGTMFGPAGDGVGASDAFRTLCQRGGIELSTPDRIGELCCGTPWKSKGLLRGYAVMRDTVLPALWEATGQGRLPVVCDAASCTEGLVQMVESDPEQRDIRIVDAVPFVRDDVLPELDVARRVRSLALHATCSSTRLGTNDALHALASAVSDRVDVPAEWGCCAFAGDRGLLHPELTASATKDQARAVRASGAVAHASTNRTCEIGMTRATGATYRHVLEIVEEATRPAGP